MPKMQYDMCLRELDLINKRIIANRLSGLVLWMLLWLLATPIVLVVPWISWFALSYSTSCRLSWDVTALGISHLVLPPRRYLCYLLIFRLRSTASR